jgi:hypothetical protein
MHTMRAAAAVSTSIRARACALEALQSALGYLHDDIDFAHNGSPGLGRMRGCARLLERLHDALASGRYVLIERGALEGIVESAECVQSLLIAHDAHERDEE